MKQPTLVAAMISTLLLCRVASGAPVERTVSPSRQFIIYGADARVRGAISELAERTKKDLLALLHQTDGWIMPVLINLQLPQTTRAELPAAAFHVSQTGFGLKLQLDLMLASNVDVTTVERELLRALVVEMIYRNQPNVAPGTVLAQPPPWLLEGILAAAPGQDRAPLVEALLSSREPISLQQFLQQNPALLDSPARMLYRAYSLALVQLLLASDDGTARLSGFVANLTHASNDPLADLKARFPALGDEPEKTWRAHLARVCAVEGPRLFSFAQTQRGLEELLQGNGGSATETQLAQFSQKKISAADKAALAALRQNLLELTVHANPLLRPVVQEYEQITVLLLTGKHRGIAQRLAQLKSMRTRLAARMRNIDDYMNWFEATQSQTKSGVFVDYLRTATKPGTPEPRRRDPLSIYLDAVEQQTQN
ncbi:MAG TPA: hypothetical protein VFO30_06090 [Chthoniobacterales bacterium]|nr:hypothetical protein [Chthoniobacterales bacterium]